MNFDWSRFAQDVEHAVYRDFESVAAAARTLNIAQNTLRKIMRAIPVNPGVRVKVLTGLQLPEADYRPDAPTTPPEPIVARSNPPALPATTIGPAAHPLATYIGRYRLVRRLYGTRRAFVESEVEVFPHAGSAALLFIERKPYATASGDRGVVVIEGEVQVSALLSTMHFLSVAQGGVRLVTIWKPGAAEMLGVVLSQTPNRNFFSPAVSPVLLQRQVGAAALEPKGAIERGDVGFDRIESRLSQAEAQFFFQSSPSGVDESFSVPD